MGLIPASLTPAGGPVSAGAGIRSVDCTLSLGAVLAKSIRAGPELNRSLSLLTKGAESRSFAVRLQSCFPSRLAKYVASFLCTCAHSATSRKRLAALACILIASAATPLTLDAACRRRPRTGLRSYAVDRERPLTRRRGGQSATYMGR